MQRAIESAGGEIEQIGIRQIASVILNSRVAFLAKVGRNQDDGKITPRIEGVPRGVGEAVAWARQKFGRRLDIDEPWSRRMKWPRCGLQERPHGRKRRISTTQFLKCRDGMRCLRIFKTARQRLLGALEARRVGV